ncbi:MAG: hypothetical protein P4M00_24760 [Azospirillaceae bacterium]|nr:hypothetical protein [Azospirillaceae bacterium]
MFDNDEINALIRKREVELAEHRRSRAEITDETHEKFAALGPVLHDLVLPINDQLQGVGRLAVTDQAEDFLVTFYAAQYQGGHYIKGVFELRLTADSQVEILMRIHGDTVPDETLAFEQATAERLGKRLNLFVADCLRTPHQAS